MVCRYTLIAFAAVVSHIFAEPGIGLSLHQRGDACGTETTEEDIQEMRDFLMHDKVDSHDTLTTHARSRLLSARQAPVYPWENVTIDTYFHVISGSTNLSDGYIPQERIYSQLDFMNKRFAPYKFAFKLKGITRTINPNWTDHAPGSELEFKRALRQGDYRTLNIYILRNLRQGFGGLTTYPRYNLAPGSDDFIMDGILMLHTRIFGGPGGPLVGPLSLGTLLCHEVGHWLYLVHTFGFQEPYSCDSSDFIPDTPAENGPAMGCIIGRDSCPDQPGLDPINNYMAYTSDLCANEFTPLQAKRMWDSWFIYRIKKCDADNCARSLRASTIPGRLEESRAFCNVIYTDVIVTDLASFPKYAIDACPGNIVSRVSSACICLLIDRNRATTSTRASTTTSLALPSPT